jgi:nicotinamidase-related amidase
VAPVLVTVDVQTGFDAPVWGPRNNPGAEANIHALQNAFRARGLGLVHVQHLSRSAGSPLAVGTPGTAFKPEAMPLPGEVVVTKHVNSGFIGTDLEAILRGMEARPVVVAGLTTCHCVSTTIRMAANLGFEVVAIADAMAQFDLRGPGGAIVPAALAHDTELAALLGEFADVTTTRALVAAL